VVNKISIKWFTYDNFCDYKNLLNIQNLIETELGLKIE
jgi:hypothetical protein